MPRAVLVMDLSAISRATQRPVQVLLCRDVSEANVVDLDFRAGTVAFPPHGAFEPPTTPCLPLALPGGVRNIPIDVAGTSAPAVLDLGHNGALLLDGAFASKLGLFVGRRVSTTHFVGADRPQEGVVTSLDRIEVGGLTFDGVPSKADAGLACAAPANVGLSILSRFHLIVDYQDNRIWMLPYPDAAKAPFRKDRSGLAVIAEAGYLTVTHVASGSPAQRTGFKTDDPIAAVDSQAIGPGCMESPQSLLLNAASGRQAWPTDRNAPCCWPTTIEPALARA